jgi:hypothetical protein
LQRELISINYHCRRVFGDERGKTMINDDTDEVDEEWNRFKRRRAGRMAAMRAVEAKKRVMTSMQPSFLFAGYRCQEANHILVNGRSPDENESLSNTGGSDAELDTKDPPAFQGAPLSPSKNNEDTYRGRPLGSPFTPPGLTRRDAIIDPTLLNTPDLVPDRSASTLTPSVPQTPDAPGSFTQGASSPLSNVPEVNTSPGTTEEIPRLKTAKRKRQVSRSEQPKAKPALRVRRKAAHA